MGDLVLKTRVAVTRRNLRLIRNLNETLAGRAAGLRAFLLLPANLQETIGRLQDQCMDLQGRARYFRDDDPELFQGLKTLNENLDTIFQGLDANRAEAVKVQQELLQFEGPRDDIHDFLAQRAEESENTLTEQNYFKNRVQIEDFFAEYVDLLRGVALRNAGFREQDNQLGDIFLIADQLPRLWGRVGGWAWQSLAVPSYEELNGKSQAMMLRLGFPEWTLWALPSVQNEFAHVYVSRATLAPPNVVSPYDDTLLADALATVVTGPAYACATLLLRLDPAAVNDASPVVALRSATIVGTLQRAAAAAGSGPLAMLTERLRSEWRDAVAIADGDPAIFDQAMNDPAVEIAAQRAQVTALGRSADGAPHVPAWAEKWATIGTWAELLRGDKAADIVLDGVNQSGGDRPIALAFLLDAAWLARVGPTAARDAPEQDLDKIAQGTIRRMLEITQGSSGAPQAGGRRARRNL